MDVVAGNPLDRADGVTPSREESKPPGAVTGVLARPGATQDGPKTCCIRYTRYSSHGCALVDYEFRPMDVARCLQTRTSYSFREPKVNPGPGGIARWEGVLHLYVQSLKWGPDPGPPPVPWIHGVSVYTSTIQAAQLSRQPGNPNLCPLTGGTEPESRVRGPTVLPGVWSISAAPSGPLAHAYVTAVTAAFRCTQAGERIS